MVHKDNEFSWLQLTDLHMYKSYELTAQKKTFSKLAEKINPSFIVVSGDFRSLNGTKTFDEARSFLKEVILPAFNLMEEDVYFVPGNHDVDIGDSSVSRKIGHIIKNAVSDPYLKEKDINFLTSRFSEYKSFVSSFYKGTKVKDDRVTNPAGVYSITKYDRINLLFLNSALASKRNKKDELVDVDAISNIVDSHNGLPSIVIAHHNPDQLLEKQHQKLNIILSDLNVVAWCCGDTHKVMAKSSGGREYLGENNFPVFVSGKTVIQKNDTYSDINVIYYSCKDNAISVHVYEYSDGSTEARGFHESRRFRDVNDNPYKIDLNICKDTESTSTGSASSFYDVIGEYKKKIKNELLLPWLYDSTVSFDAIFPTLFITPKLKSKKRLSSYKSIDSLIRENIKSNIIISGDAGIGKSTLLKYLFLFKNDDNRFLYVRASDLISNGAVSNAYFDYVNDILCGRKSGYGITLLLDGIDEAYENRSEKLDLLIDKINRLTDVHVWLGWRKEHLNRYRTKELDCIITDEFYIENWTIRQSEHFVKQFANKTTNKKLYEEFKSLISKSNDINEFSRNPFQLTLLVYLLENKFDSSEKTTALSLYNLYNRFLKLWIKKECGPDNVDEIINKLTGYAQTIYYGSDGCEIKDTDSVIRDLFHFSSLEHAVEFCHRSLAAFLIAKRVLVKIISGCEDLKVELSTPLKDDVTQFIKSAAKDLDDKTISDIHTHLADAYFTNRLISNAVGNIAFVEEDLIPSKNSIVYLLTRIKNENNSERDSSKLLREIDEYEKDIRMQVTIAYGAAKLGIQDIALKYAREFYNEDSKFALTTRSFSLVYYGDVLSNDLYGYCDNGSVDWTKSREVRFNDLWAKNKNDPYFCILDIPLLHNFYISRGWKNASLKDYIKICFIRIDHSILKKEVDEFLTEKLKDFKTDYLRHMLAKKSN